MGWGTEGDGWGTKEDGWGTADEAPKKDFNRNGGKGCFNCGESGHMSRDCTAPKKSDGGGGRNCFNCGNSGHMSRDCPEPKKSDGKGCFNCGESGHMSRDCTAPRKSGGGGNRSCFNCGESGHMSRDCTAPKKSDGGGGGSSGGGGWGGSSGGGGWGESSGGGGWGSAPSDQTSSAPKSFENNNRSNDRGEKRNHAGNDGWSSSGNDCDKQNDSPAKRPRTDGPEDRPAPFKPEELDLDEEAKIQGGTGVNFSKYSEHKVACFPKDIVKPVEKFEDIITSGLLLARIKSAEYLEMTPVQKWAMPIIRNGHDLISCAQTGSGKTAAFLLPVLQDLLQTELEPHDPNRDCQEPYCLIISPTRELAQQLHTHSLLLSRDSKIKCQVMYGQIATPHLKARLSQGCHLLVSTPGRLKDFVGRGWIGFKNIKYVILDEGDRLVDEGFTADIKNFFNHESMPSKEFRQTLFFSATFKKETQINAKEYLKEDFVFLTVGRVGAANENIKQEFMKVSRQEKKRELKTILNALPESDKTIIFTQTKSAADMLAGFFTALGLSSTSIHGDRHQSQREQAIRSFRKGEKRFLISSPVGNRGLDLPKVALVINYDLPSCIDEYVHRIGRTGRAGHIGKAISFFDDERDQELLPELIAILTEAKQEIPDWMQGGNTTVTAQDGSADDWGSSTAQVSSTNQTATANDDWGDSPLPAESETKETMEVAQPSTSNTESVSYEEPW